MTTWSISATWAIFLFSTHSISKTDCQKQVLSTMFITKHKKSWRVIAGDAVTDQKTSIQSYKTWLYRGNTRTKISVLSKSQQRSWGTVPSDRYFMIYPINLESLGIKKNKPAFNQWPWIKIRRLAFIMQVSNMGQCFILNLLSSKMRNIELAKSVEVKAPNFQKDVIMPRIYDL